MERLTNHSASHRRAGRKPHWRQLALIAAAGSWLLLCPVANWAKGLEVRHEPPQPRTGEPVRITADFHETIAPPALVLQFQVVEPGKYIARSDREYETRWDSVNMTAGAEKSSQAVAGGRLVATLPAELQKHRRLIRYRIWSPGDRKVIAPDPKDSQSNFAYFVYNGVPAWSGAIDPRSSDPNLRRPIRFPAEALERVPVYHFISRKTWVENVTWNEPANFSEASRHEYKYSGTLVYNGIVYDHVQFRARGGMWRHAMGKNMWKFNFLPGHHFQARDFYGKLYEAKWDKLNLGACIQQGDYGMRGEQGIFEALGFRLFNVAGLAASRTHWVHLRIIDQEQESSANQFSGDFWGLYLAVENVDAHFLKEHHLPRGNLYKIESWRAKTEFQSDTGAKNQEDVNEFLRATMRRQAGEVWWEKTVDLPRYYSYRSILECIHHYDLDAGKNYFYYLNPASQRWLVIPWDLDLSWGDQMYGGGREPFYQAGVLRRPNFRFQYQERLAEIRDLLFNEEQLGLLIDEYAAMIFDPNGRPSIADADRAKWDYNPVMASSRVMGSKAGQGRFYFGDSRNRFPIMVQYIKGYAAKRMHWVDQFLLGEYRPSPAPKIAPVPGLTLRKDPARLQSSPPELKFQIESKRENSGNQIVRWRLAEITDPRDPSFDPRQPRHYEINALWEKEFNNGPVTAIPGNLVQPGHLYRVRARGQDANGHWTRWSSSVQFRATGR